MKILLTGATGFFGKSLFRFWKDTKSIDIINSKIIILSRNPKRFYDFIKPFMDIFDIDLIEGDVEVYSSLKMDDYTHVLHAATDSTLGSNLSSLARYNQIFNGTKNILDLSVKCGVSKILLTSSGAIYGDISQFNQGVKEKYYGSINSLLSKNSYALAKRSAEHLCALYYDKFGLRYSIARCFAFIGEDLPMNVHFAIGNFIGDAINGRDIIIHGNGQQVRTYLHQSELAKWLTAILLENKETSIYNVGSNEKTTIENVAKLITKYFESKKPKVIIQNKETNAFRNYYVPNVDLIKQELGLRVEINLQEAIKRVIDSKTKN